MVGATLLPWLGKHEIMYSSPTVACIWVTGYGYGSMLRYATATLRYGPFSGYGEATAREIFSTPKFQTISMSFTSQASII